MIPASVDLPIPGSPASQTTPPRPSNNPANTERRAPTSRSRPNTSGTCSAITPDRIVDLSRPELRSDTYVHLGGRVTPQRLPDDLDPRVHAQLGHDVRDVGLHGRAGHDQR